MFGKRISGSAIALVVILGGAGVSHFMRPQFFDPLVPDWMPGSKRAVTYVSGAVEAACAALVLHPKTRRLGGALSLLTFVGVFPANVQAALDGGMKDMAPPFDSPLAAWLRLPFQIPLIWLASRVARKQSR